MDIGNDVDLSNNNIVPLWKQHKSTAQVPENLNKAKQRPLSCHVNGVMTSGVPLEDNTCSSMYQPVKRIDVANPENTNRVVLTHVLHKPTKKKRIVRAISNGHHFKGRFSLSKPRTGDSRRPLNAEDERVKNGGEPAIWSEKCQPDVQKSTPGSDNLSLQCDRLPQTPKTSHELPCLSSASSSSSLSQQTLTPSYSSSSSIPSLLSLTSSDPPSPRSSSPTERVQTPVRHSPTSTTSAQETVRSSPTTACPSPSAAIASSVVLSTNSPAALKMGTQQLIPKGLASDTRQIKPAGSQGQGLAGLIGFDPSKRSLKALSMVETGSYFSTSGSQVELMDGEDESLGNFTRGLRSTSYRKAVVSGSEDQEQPLLFEGLSLAGPGSPVDSSNASSLDSIKTMSPATPASSSPKISKTVNHKTDKKIKSPDKKKLLISQPTFDSEEEELYQNYKEKALQNDSDEDADSRMSKPDDAIVVQYRPLRTSWSQLSVVKKSGLSEKLSQEERKRQEAIFELISSEHSYSHSLEILIRLFKNSTELCETMTKMQHHHLFSNISDVCEASKKFFRELEERHQQSIVIDDISDIVCKHSQSNFDPFITYCSNEVYQQRTLQKLVSKNPAFKEVLTRIEAHPDCKNLPMISFLILPMQRITRLPLLMDTICQKTPKDSEHYEKCNKALQDISKVVRKCNEGARKMERTEMMYTINSQLEFKIKPFPLVSSSRWMVKRGELTAYVEGNFLKRTSRQQVYLFLFNDVLIITRKKSEDSYTVTDYALRDQISVGTCQPEDVRSPLSSRPFSVSHLFQLSLECNHAAEKVHMILGAESLNERARWVSALGQNASEKSLDKSSVIQVELVRTYTARQPDELSLQVADVVLVLQTVDGWHQGERLRDGERGWFLAECAVPITCQATIERNMQRMNRLQGLETDV